MKLMQWRPIYFAISLAFLIPGLISLVLFGLRPAIDFTGGSLWEVTLPQPVEPSRVEAIVDKVYSVSSVNKTGENSVIIRGEAIDPARKQQAVSAMQTELGTVNEVRFETVGPVLGKELIQKTIVAILIVAGIITWYVARQFSELKYGISAIAAMFHDSLILLGVFSILGKVAGVEVDVLFVTALLTTLSFSVHDTIVVFDRIRELKRKHPRDKFEDITNAAVLETMGRSINNSMTIIFMLTALVLMGGESIRWFATALLIGAITGTYSSTFTAVPLLLLWDDAKKRLAAKN